MKRFDSILVANRGEIAVRVIRSAKQQGYRTVAVYSEADAGALHVQLADEAVLIGPPPVTDSYLDAESIIRAARQTNAGAVHPGYGFLSENAAFAAACEQAGLVFIGPSPEAIELMGNKAAAKRCMLEAGVPCVPGYQDEDQSDATLLAAAADIGAPLMVKAAAGGGGRGLRLVTDLAELPQALASARSEAENAFGSGELILEKALVKPRHVEIQVFGDSEGNVIHLGERDCSVQRRHQKVVEESPCPVISPELRQAMGQAAVDAAKSIRYAGAGTVEFLLDANGKFYFLEMNTRLQVEHPVTEMVTGLDLVALQFHVAQGYPLPLSQDQVRMSGHAIEVRLYAEDTHNGFLPATGTALVWQPPSGEGIRVDHGLLEGQEISPFYDPMIAKVVAWGEDRDIARRRLVRALQGCSLLGLQTNREFLIDILQKQSFAEGRADTAFIEEHYADRGLSAPPPTTDHLLAAACLQYRAAQSRALATAVAISPQLLGFRNSSPVDAHYCYGEGENCAQLAVREIAPGHYQVRLNGDCHQLHWESAQDKVARIGFGDVEKILSYSLADRGEVSVQIEGVAQVLTDRLSTAMGADGSAGRGDVVAPMHGNVAAVLVSVGDRVSAGQTLAVMEAMKMEHRLQAGVAGVVIAVHASAGAQLAAGAPVLEIEETGQE